MKYAQIRICEWTADIRQIADPASQLRMANGATFLEMDDDEKLSDVEVMTTGKSHHVPMEVDGKTINVPHTTYAFRATLVKAVDEAVVQVAVDEEEKREAEKPKHHVVLPGQANRKERRTVEHAKGRPSQGYKPNGK